MTEPVRWGVLGIASIFERRMVPAFAAASNAHVVAVASRSLDKANEAARKHDIPAAFGSYEELLRSPDIEAVYIPLPNDLHAEWTLEALARGKHVLCDKPAALSFADATRMSRAAQAAALRLMEGFMFRHHPQHARVAEIIASGEIGNVAHFRGTFTYAAEERHRSTYRFNPAQGGGALFDVGVYPLNAVRLHFGTEPLAVSATAAFDASSGVDQRILVLGEWADGRTAVVEGGFDQTFTSRYEIAGDKGVVTTERAFQAGDGPITLFVRNGDDVRTETIPGTNQYVREIEHFSACVRDPQKPLAPGENGAAQARVVEAVRRSLVEKRRVAVAEVEA
jgi:predicted dehydrogenase